MSKHIYVYTCGVNFQHEMTQGHVDVYPTIEDCKVHNECWVECGIVRLKVELDEWVEPQENW
jgi:hypothetical protein